VRQAYQRIFDLARLSRFGDDESFALVAPVTFVSPDEWKNFSALLRRSSFATGVSGPPGSRKAFTAH